MEFDFEIFAQFLKMRGCRSYAWANPGIEPSNSWFLQLWLKELREAEIGIDMNIGPIEESYALLNRFELTFDDGNVERVDSIGYAWKNVQQQSVDVQNQLIKVQPEFKENLNAGVAKFKEDTAKFYVDFDQEGPLVEGIKPAEASDRVTVFQSRFDELWRKVNNFSSIFWCVEILGVIE